VLSSEKKTNPSLKGGGFEVAIRGEAIVDEKRVQGGVYQGNSGGGRTYLKKRGVKSKGRWGWSGNGDELKKKEKKKSSGSGKEKGKLPFCQKCRGKPSDPHRESEENLMPHGALQKKKGRDGKAKDRVTRPFHKKKGGLKTKTVFAKNSWGAPPREIKGKREGPLL